MDIGASPADDESRRFVLGGHVFAGSLAVVSGVTLNQFGWEGLYFWWSIITAWVVLLAVIFTLRYLQGGWQTKRVIEPPVVE